MLTHSGVPIIDYTLLIYRERGHYREILDRGDKRQRGQYIKGEVWDFPVMTEQTRLISYLFNGLFTTDLSLRPIKSNNWSADKLSPWYSQVRLVSGYPFWQLSIIDHNMDVHKDVHYQLKTRIVYALDTSLVMTSRFRKTANQSTRTIVAI